MTRNKTTLDERGTEQSPIVVKVVPSPKAQDEAANGKEKELRPSSPDWWMVYLTGAIVFIGFVQTIVFGIQAYRLKQTINKMEELGGSQTADMQRSIREATRAATAMEQVATSMAISVGSVKESVGINREIADRQN